MLAVVRRNLNIMRKFLSTIAGRWFLFDNRKFVAEWLLALFLFGLGAILLFALYRFFPIAPGFGRGALCWLVMTLFSFKFFSAASGCEICPVTPLVTLLFACLVETGVTQVQRKILKPDRALQLMTPGDQIGCLDGHRASHPPSLSLGADGRCSRIL